MPRFPQLPILPRLPLLAGVQLPEDRLLGIPATEIPAEPEISPEEERGLLRSLAGGASYVAESLGKPQAALGGFLSTGDPSQLLHAVPFSETLGFAPAKKYSGRQMLQKFGILGPNKPGFDIGDIAGFAAEVATDPLLLLTGPLGTISKGAAFASKGVKSLEAAQTALKATRASVAAGKLTGLGRLLKTPVGVAEQIRSGERGLLGLKIPFAAEPLVTFGEGSKVGAWAVEKMFYGGGHANPLVWMRGLFSHTAPAKNLPEFFQRHPGALQRGKDLAFAERQLVSDALTDLGTALVREEPRLMAKFAQLAAHHGANGDRDAFDAFTRAMLEVKGGLPKGDDLLLKVREAMGAAPDAALDDLVTDGGRLADNFYRYAESIQDMQNATYARLEALGMPVTWLDDLYGAHTARRPSDIVRGYLAAGKRQRMDQWYKWWMHRRYRNLPGMTPVINAAARNPLLTATKDITKAGRAMFSEAELETILKRGGDVTPAMARQRFNQNVVKRLKELGVPDQAIPQKTSDLQTMLAWEEHFQRPFEEFWTAAQVDDAGQLLDDAGEVVMHNRVPVTRESEKMRLMGEMATGKVPFQAGKEKMPLIAVGGPKVTTAKGAVHRLVQHLKRLPPEVREKGIFDRRPLEDAVDYMHSVLEWESNLRSMHRFLGQEGVARLATDKPDWLPLSEVWRTIRTRGRSKGLTPEGLDTFLNSVSRQFPQVADLKADLRVSPGTARILQNYIDIMRPQYKAGWQSLVDPVNRLFRSLYFMVWPASHVRNLGGGFFNSWSAGHVNFWDLLAGNKAALKYLKGKAELQVEPLFGVTDLLKGVGRDLEIAGTESKLGGIPQLGGRTALGHILEPITPAGLQRRGVGVPKGVKQALGEAGTVARGPMEAGTRAYNVVEFLNRVGYAEALAKKGFADADIVRFVQEAQFNYSKASPFEREYVQRGVLFWQWPRNNVPFILANLAARPGGRTAQTLRAMQAARGDEEQEYVPEMLREGLAVRTGGSPEAAHFIRQSGIPVEDLNRIILEGGLPTGRTLERGASMLHPLLLAPLELASGRQFYTGRKISNLYSTSKEMLGKQIPALDRLIAYSPLSRVFQEAAGVVDTRKKIYQRALNALTGVKTSTYDLESLREQDLRRALERELKRMPEVSEVTEPYIPKAKQAEASQEALRKLRQLRAVKQRIRDLREERAQREAVAGR